MVQAKLAKFTFKANFFQIRPQANYKKDNMKSLGARPKNPKLKRSKNSDKKSSFTSRKQKSIELKACKKAWHELVDLALLPTYAFRISVLGGARVGKTSLVKAFFGENFNEKHVPTVDDYYVHAFSLDGHTYHSTCIIDTSGTYRFPAMRKLAIESSQGFLVLYAMDDIESFDEALQLLDQIYTIKSIYSSRVVVNLVATKLDIDCCERKVSTEAALSAINRRTWMTGEYIEVSSKAQFRVSHSFHSLLRNMIRECSSKEKKKARRLLHRKMRSNKLVKKTFK